MSELDDIMSLPTDQMLTQRRTWATMSTSPWAKIFRQVFTAHDAEVAVLTEQVASLTARLTELEGADIALEDAIAEMRRMREERDEERRKFDKQFAKAWDAIDRALIAEQRVKELEGQRIIHKPIGPCPCLSCRLTAAEATVDRYRGYVKSTIHDLRAGVPVELVADALAALSTEPVKGWRASVGVIKLPKPSEEMIADLRGRPIEGTEVGE